MRPLRFLMVLVTTVMLAGVSFAQQPKGGEPEVSEARSLPRTTSADEDNWPGLREKLRGEVAAIESATKRKLDLQQKLDNDAKELRDLKEARSKIDIAQWNQNIALTKQNIDALNKKKDELEDTLKAEHSKSKPNTDLLTKAKQELDKVAQNLDGQNNLLIFQEQQKQKAGDDIDVYEAKIAKLTAEINSEAKQASIEEGEASKVALLIQDTEDRISAFLASRDVSNKFKMYTSFIFAGLVLFVICGFFYVAIIDGKVRVAIFSHESGIQFITLFSLVIAIILFGITGILEGKELSALLGGLSGYILGRGVNVGQPPTTPNQGTHSGGISTPQQSDSAEASDKPEKPA